jgi:hypothetical protein
VGLFSGLVLGFLAAVMVVHFFLNRRINNQIASKASGYHMGNVSPTYQSPCEAFLPFLGL